MTARSKETEAVLRDANEWVGKIRRLFLPFVSAMENDATLCGRQRRECAQLLIDEVPYFQKLFLRFSADWPEFQDLASECQRLIDEARELIA